MNRIWATPNFLPARSGNGMISSIATVEEAQQHLSVKRFSAKSFDLPENFAWTPMAPVMKQACMENFPQHIKDKQIKGVNDLKDAHKGKTAILCGAGYSIHGVKDLIPPKDSVAHKDMVVIAMNGSLKALQPSQVDYFGCLDWSSPDTWAKGYDTTGIKAIIGATVPGHFIESFKDRHYFVSNVFGFSKELHDEWSPKLGQLDSGKCVTYSMMHMAYQMGCSKVIFLGHDFACVGGHAFGNYYYWEKDLEFNYASSQNMIIAQDIFGRATITGPIMIGNCEMAMTASKFCEMDSMPCVNASEAGIMAMKDRCMPFEDALNFTPNIPVHIPTGRDRSIPALDWSNWRKAS